MTTATTGQKPSYQISTHAQVLSAIFARETNLCVWQRTLPDSTQRYIALLQKHTRYLNLTRQVTAQNVTELLAPCLPEGEGKTVLIEDIALLTEMLICLFDCQPDNEGRGVVHRSPALAAGTKRLLLTLDPDSLFTGLQADE
ncbi:DUF1826 domain-containing protein [Lacimicrobium alkaliphilum]|uniref:DUF1826 domain-containing protein n=1 Tax=Lacimicrobium alkaliphilum TaxID=1526571 RepID=A0ABQ1RNZ8_9ALTE|nr:DUF1826 domain-containing protein [Lacimicrobium alkaliphilum]GGD76587.1 hypothetical protein GCM10011357_34500 [Lacimicrobium alkaliphilum]